MTKSLNSRTVKPPGIPDSVTAANIRANRRSTGRCLLNASLPKAHGADDTTHLRSSSCNHPEAHSPDARDGGSRASHIYNKSINLPHLDQPRYVLGRPISGFSGGRGNGP